MKKNIILLGALAVSSMVFSQVGIDTDIPKATLDIKATPTSTTKIDGLIAPRVTGDQLKTNDSKYTTDQDAAIVYVTAAISGIVSDKTTNVTSVGYYYFDKTQSTGGRWMKIANPTAVTAYQEPWNVQGGTTAATTNTQNIYQSGSVAIGRTLVYTNGSRTAALDVKDAIRTGAGQLGTIGVNSVAMGLYNEASGDASFAGGQSNKSIGNGATSFGNGNTNSGDNAFVTGSSNTVNTGATNVFAGGRGNTVSGNYGYVTGYLNTVSGDTAGAFGFQNTSSGARSIATGFGATASADNAFAMGGGTKAQASNSVATGLESTANAQQSLVGGYRSVTGTAADNSIAYGNQVEADGSSAVAFGQGNKSIGNMSMTMGYQNTANGNSSIVGGTNSSTSVAGSNSLAIGNTVQANGNNSVATGNLSIANGNSSIVGGTGSSTSTAGINSLAIGNGVQANGSNSFATGNTTKATGFASVSLGEYSEANSNYSLSSGYFNTTSNPSETALGAYNLTFPNALFTVGDGTGTGNTSVSRSNIISVLKAGTNAGNFVAIGSATAIPVKLQDEKLRIYGAALANKAYVTDINTVAGATTDKLVVADATTGQLKTIAASSITTAYQEPWNVQGGTTAATTNSQNIFQNGSVSIGKNAVYTDGTNSVKFEVAGAVRGGAGQAGTVGSNSAAFGNGAKATGPESFAIGNNVTASGSQSFAGGGQGAIASGVYAFAFGNAAKAVANHAVAMGVGTVAPARSSVTIGRYNVNTFTTTDPAQNLPEDPIFQVGSGADDLRRFNIITTFLGTNGTIGTGGGWMAIGGDINTMPTRFSTETLRVYGGVNATSYAVNATTLNVPDYVFQNYYTGNSTLKGDYKFVSNLYDVENYLKENHHLPGVTSASEIKKAGFYNLEDMQMQSLEKVEELYLHTIEQQKQIDAQKAQIETLINLTEKLQQKLDKISRN